MGKIYVCSDLHLDHTNIIKYCNRPYADTEAMNKALIENWNSVVGEDDTVFCLGDFCLGDKDTIINLGKQLNGKKFLILGNHDHGSKSTYKEAGFTQVYGEQAIIKFEELDTIIHFSHHRVPDDDTHYLNLYGHQHDKPTDDDKHKCVCVELWDYKPVLLDTFIK
jgi:calcineurin-like phosphoesterase family protein